MDRQKKVSLWWAKNFRPLVVALLVGCGVHYTIYANQLGTMDAVHIGALYIADGWPEHLYWETEQGRWALRLVDMLRGGINQPALSALLMLFLYALAGVLLTDLFGVRSRTAKYLIPLTLVCAALCGGDRVFPLLQRVLCAVLPAGCAGGAVRCLRSTLCLAGGHGLYGVLAGNVSGQSGHSGGLVRHAADSGGSAPPRRVESHRPDRSAHGADGRQRRGAVYADFKGCLLYTSPSPRD